MGRERWNTGKTSRKDLRKHSPPKILIILDAISLDKRNNLTYIYVYTYIYKNDEGKRGQWRGRKEEKTH